MSRVIAGAGAALIATVLILGPGRALLPGGARTELPGAGSVQPADVHAGHEAGTSAPAAAQPAKPGPNAARVTLAARPSEKLTLGYALTVHLAAVDGRPVNETAVTYYQIVDLFGQHEMLIGDATTDGQGDATLFYLPAQLGSHEIVARSSSKGQVTWGEARITLDARVAAATYRVEPPPLAAFSAVLPYGVGALVLFVWALLAFALLATARGVLGGARDHAQKKGDIA